MYSNQPYITKSQKIRARKKRILRNRLIAIIVLIIAIASVICIIKKATENQTAGNITTGANTINTANQENNDDYVSSYSKPETKTEWNMLLVNADHPLPDNFKVKLKKINDQHKVDERIYDSLMNMISDCEKAGLSPLICSSYRTQQKQESLYSNKTNEYVISGYSIQAAKKLAGEWVAVPGTSEHQLGLAVDIVSINNQNLDESQEDTPEQKWLMSHCQDYGFILRYPTSKKNITKINYEPWHYRYVGIEAAKEIMSRGICFEEYLQEK